MSSPGKCSNTVSATGSDKILGHEDVSGLIFDKLSLAELVTLGEAQPALLQKIKALEERWMRGCIELCGGTLDWLDTEDMVEQCGESWMEAWQTLKELRTEWLNVSVPSFNGGLYLPEKLPWGDEEWSRLHDLPQEAEREDAYARAALCYQSLLDGCGDEQCDTFPIGVGFYRRTAQTAAEGPLGSEETREENIVKLREAFYPECDEVVELERHVLEPISVSALLANLPSPMAAVKEGWRPASVPLGLPLRFAERAIFDAAARSASFAALCVGDSPVLSPGLALDVLYKTCRRILHGVDQYECSEMPMGEKGEYEKWDSSEGVYEDVTALGVDMVERALKAQLAEVIEEYEPEGLDLKALSHASATETPLGLCWGDMPAPQHKPRGNAKPGLVSAAVAAFEAHKLELDGLIRAQLRAVLSAEERSALELAEGAARAEVAEGAKGAATVHPVMLTNSDVLRRFWSDAPQYDNDHEGVQAFAFVSETWALVLASKSASC